MNQDSKVVKKGITWLPPSFALNMFTHLTILRDCWPCLRERGELPDKSRRDAWRKVKSEPLRETNVAVAEA